MGTIGIRLLAIPVPQDLLIRRRRLCGDSPCETIRHTFPRRESHDSRSLMDRKRTRDEVVAEIWQWFDQSESDVYMVRRIWEEQELEVVCLVRGKEVREGNALEMARTALVDRRRKTEPGTGAR